MSICGTDPKLFVDESTLEAQAKKSRAHFQELLTSQIEQTSALYSLNITAYSEEDGDKNILFLIFVS
jgi:hypothetical protein